MEWRERKYRRRQWVWGRKLESGLRKNKRGEREEGRQRSGKGMEEGRTRGKWNGKGGMSVE